MTANASRKNVTSCTAKSRSESSGAVLRPHEYHAATGIGALEPERDRGGSRVHFNRHQIPRRRQVVEIVWIRHLDAVDHHFKGAEQSSPLHAPVSRAAGTQ